MSMKNFIKDFLLEQDENLVTITPEQYIENLEDVGGIASRVAKLKQYRGKGIVINNNIDLRNFKNIGPLTGVVRVMGRLDISGTNVPNLDGTDVDGYISNWNSTMKNTELKKERDAKISKLNEYRENDTWDVGNGDDESERTEALYDYLIEEGVPDRIKYEDGRESEEDKYFIYPNGRGTYSVGKQYEWLGGETLSPVTYDVYSQDELDVAAKRYVEQAIDDMGYEAFREWVWEDAIEKDKWKEWLTDFYEETVSDDPDGYEVEKSLSYEQEEQVNKINNTVSNLTKKLEDPNLSDEEKNKIKIKIYGLEDIIKNIEEDPQGDYDEDSIRSIAESFAEEYVDNMSAFIENYGFDKKFILDFVDLDAITDTVVNSDGYGTLLNSYDGEMFETQVNGDWYFVMRVS
jgi:hypothetical protein